LHIEDYLEMFIWTDTPVLNPSKLLILVDVFKRNENELMPSALKVRVMYEKAPEILMLMERMCTLQPVMVTMLEHQLHFSHCDWFIIHYSY